MGLDCVETNTFWKFVDRWVVEEFGDPAQDSEEVIFAR
jgi:hypothetical protein